MFSSKVVLVTGGSSGIGAETALEFSKLGANVVITGRNQSNLEKVAKDCEEASPSKLKPLAIIADVTKEEDNENVIKTIIDKYEKLDVLINNAGIVVFDSIETTSLEQYDAIMNTNMRGVYHLTMLATPHLIKTKGNIVNVSSLAGLRAFPELLCYSVSKAALDQFTKCVALELAPKGVRVNSVNPGVIVTNILLNSGMSEEEYAKFMEKCNEIHAIGRPGYVNEVSSVIAFLAGDGASNMTGVTVPVDGGRHAMCPR